jgi:uncharacterized protein
MENALSLAQSNLLSPVVLCFALGAVATFVRSDLKIPEAVYSLLTIYLLLSIGLKGGVELSHSSLLEVWKPILAALFLGTITPLVAIGAARAMRMNIADSAALGAHYGSISVVTFIAVRAFLDAVHAPVSGYVTSLAVVMEIPGILVSLLVASLMQRSKALKSGASDSKTSPALLKPRPLGVVVHEILTGRSLVLLLGGLVIGFVSGTPGYARVEPFFGPPFQGAVALFLLEMGMLAARRARDLRKLGASVFVFLLAFGTLVPAVNASLGLLIGHAAGLSLGSATILATLAGSASYIAAPAAVRLALPEANPGLYLNAALTVTFPFNLAIGIPSYYALASFLYEVWP